MQRTKAAWMGVAIGCWLAVAAAAITDGEKCEADKIKTAGKYAACRMNAESKAIKKGVPPDYSKCNAKYSLKWGTVEGKAGGACPVTGDEVDVQTQATECADGLTATIGGNPPPGCSELCGNGALEGDEDCDFGTLNGATCVSEGFAGGVLSCADGCAFDTSACYAARFVDNADGTITDNDSGLMWEKKTQLNGSTNFANAHDADNFYRWSGTCTVLTSKRCQPTAAAAALCAASVEGNPDGCSECTGGDGTCDQPTTMWTVLADRNTANFAGHSDWRAPTRQELESILNLADTTPPVVDAAFQGASCGVACTDITDAACSCTQSNYYWSATTYAPDTTNAWVVGVHDGFVDAYYKPFSFLYVRAVRGGS